MELEVPILVIMSVKRGGVIRDHCPTIEDYADFIIKIEFLHIYEREQLVQFRMMKHNLDDVIVPMKLIREYQCFERIEI